MTYRPRSSPLSERDHLFLIVSGTVRLLARNEGLQKTVSVACLGLGEAFGCDRIFYGQPLPYRARAATPCQLLRLSAQALGQGLSRWPLLLGCLQGQMRRRSQLAFFKQCTPLGAVPSTTLSQGLLPRLIEQPLPAGRPLAEAALTPGDYLWLRRGHLLNPSTPDWSPQVGDGWRYALPQGHWVAQTDGLLYRLVGHSPIGDNIKRLLSV
ncbi:cyclic nucleotide-binding domain-containing protein [Nodosilinea sp. PGN35]|uniref:cyclic nucleotide-binding domain-containing protein n=1 Tax=Nodosilinea sp. PGN35 TaxID=3020489 RepID=UPI00398B8C88